MDIINLDLTRCTNGKRGKEQKDLFGIKHCDETATRARLSVCVYEIRS